MRFITQDTYDLSNKYTYCDDEPVSKSDPGGHMPKWLGAVIAGLGTVAGIALSIPSGGASNAVTCGWVLTSLLDLGTAGTTIASYYTKGKTSNKLAYASLGLGIASFVTGVASGVLKVINKAKAEATVASYTAPEVELSSSMIFIPDFAFNCIIWFYAGPLLFLIKFRLRV